MRRPLRRCCGVSLMRLAVALAAMGVCAPAARAATPQQIEEAIRKGREYLLSQQLPEGRWEKDPKRVGAKHDWEKQQGQTFGGFSAIATYALLASGSKIGDEPIAKSIRFLKTADITGAYACGLRAQIWLFLPDTGERKSLAAKDLDVLKRTLNVKGPGIGLWDYDDFTNNGARIDHSLSQYGILGFWACAQVGSGPDDKTWQFVEETWRSHQMTNGSWSYDGDGKANIKPASASMTAAGVATLFITQDFLSSNAGIACKEAPINKNIDDGIKWMTENIGGVYGNPYAWYGVERIGMAGGLKYFGDKDWFAAGADNLVGMQQKDGSWVGGFAGATGVPATSYALLFLARGRSAVAINKLEYGPKNEKGVGSSWNQRPRDVANLTKYLGWKNESPFKWQTVNLKVAAQDLNDAPILYISGSGSFTATDDEIAKLRDYVQSGGMLLANANCGKVLFSKTFKQVVTKMFPKYEFRHLTPDHPIFSKQQYNADKWRDQLDVEAMSNGVRELAILVGDADASKSWQLVNDLKRAEADEKFQFGADIFGYATDNVRNTLASSAFLAKDAGGAAPPVTMKVLRVDVGQNSDPEPGGWRRMATLFKNGGKLGLSVELAKPTPEKLTPAVLAHLTGTGKFTLTGDERSALKAFVEQGGTLVIDAAGGNAAFADAAEAELGIIFGATAIPQLKTSLPATHPVFQMPDRAMKEFKYRHFARTLVGNLKSPRVRGITTADGKRVGVFFSREDLSAGLVGQSVYGILGYDPSTATDMMGNIIFYAAQNGKGPAILAPKPAAPPATAPAAKPKPGDPLPF